MTPTTRTKAKDLRLSGILARHLDQERSYLALSRAINESNGLGVRQRALVDRRKLKQIVMEDAHLVLSLRELRAIDRYLEPFNEGLALVPLFYKPENVVSVLASTGGVTFLLGSKPEDADFRVNFSHWDVMAMVEVQRAAYHFSPHMHFDFSDVLLHDDGHEARKSLASSGWAAHFSDRGGTSLVCLGSTRALHATELMLARMFGVDPFDPKHRDEMPFNFVWSQRADHVFPSSFNLPYDEVGLPPDARALRIRAPGEDEKLLADTFTPKREGETYGVVVAQRRPSGKLWICVAGVTGLGTLAAAQALREVSAALNTGERPCPVFWMPIRARVSVSPNRPPGARYKLGVPTRLTKDPYRWEA